MALFCLLAGLETVSKRFEIHVFILKQWIVDLHFESIKFLQKLRELILKVAKEFGDQHCLKEFGINSDMLSLLKKFKALEQNDPFAEFKVDPLEEEFNRIGRITNLETDRLTAPGKYTDKLRELQSQKAKKDFSFDPSAEDNKSKCKQIDMGHTIDLTDEKEEAFQEMIPTLDSINALKTLDPEEVHQKHMREEAIAEEIDNLSKDIAEEL